MLTALRSRVILVLIAAALPAALAVYVLAARNFEVARQGLMTDLRQDSRFAMARVDAVPLAATRLATTLAAGASWDPDFEARCAERVAEIRAQYRGFDGLAMFRGGELACSSGRTPALEAMAGELSRAVWSRQPAYAGLVDDNGRARMFGAAQARPGGLIAVAFIDPASLDTVLAAFSGPGGNPALMIGSTGAPIAGADSPGLAAFWSRPLLPARAGEQSLLESGIEGDRWFSVATKLSDIDAWLIVGLSEKARLAEARRQFAGTIAGPALMIVATCLGIWLGLNRLVLQWEQRLRTASRAYTRGDLGARVGEVSGAPREFADLAADFDALADRVAERAAELEREIARRNVYIRELHHRVKNNLQMISSLLALQRRGLPKDRQAIVRFAESRVNAIAAAFQLGYRHDDAGAVEVKELILEVCHRLRADAGDPEALVADVGGDDVVLRLDDAISLAMTIAELLADRLINRPADAPAARLVARAGGDTLRMTLDDPVPVESRASALSSRLLVTYAAQLRAVIAQESPKRLTIELPLTPIRAPAS